MRTPAALAWYAASPVEEWPSVKDDRYPLFAVLYAGAAILEQAQMGTAFGANAGTAALVAAVATLFFPRSVLALAALVLAQTAHFAIAMPDIPNAGLLHLALGLAALPLLVARTARGSVDGPAWLEGFAPVVRVGVLVVYFWATWHKLNWDFFDPANSCAVALYAKVRWGLRFLPLPRAASIAWPLIIATIVVEGGIPALLISRRTRHLGLVLALAFHFVLGFGTFYAFSATKVAVLALFVSPRATGSGLRLRTWRVIVLVAILVAVGMRLGYSWHAERSILANLAGVRAIGNQFGQRLWWAYLPLLVVAIPVLLRAGDARPARELFAHRPRILLALPVVLFLNGATPYLGLKTEYSFAMYSNLRTEGGATNHFVPFQLELSDLQRDLVEIVESSHGRLHALAASRQALPFAELRRRVGKALATGGDFSIVYSRGGRRFVVPSAAADPVLGAPLGLVERKLLRFRSIPFENAGCAH